MNAHTAHFPKALNLIECDTCGKVGAVLYRSCGGTQCKSCTIEVLGLGCCYDTFEECVAAFAELLANGSIEKVTP
jgi:hypothetical protein